MEVISSSKQKAHGEVCAGKIDEQTWKQISMELTGVKALKVSL